MLDKTFESLKMDSAQTNFVRKVGLTMYESLSLGTHAEKCPLSVLNSVRIKWVNFRENI